MADGGAPVTGRPQASPATGLSLEAPSGRLAARLAALLAHPCAHLAPERLTALAGPQGAPLIGSDALRPALDAWVAQQAGTAGLDLGPGFLGRLRAEEAVQSAARLLTAPEAALRAALRLLGAAIRQADIRGALRKSERERLRAAFGEGGMQLGLRQAGTLLGSLSALASGPLPDRPLAEAEVAFGRHLDALDPALGRIADLRLGWTEALPADAAAHAAPLTPRIARDVARVLSRAGADG
ncbi:MAG: hypothetical protein ACU0BF_00740 [Paracoccaceae bacterium]